MLVSEILAIKGKVLFTVSSTKTLAEAVAVMTEQDVGSLVVFDKGSMVGMMTFREVLLATQKAGAEWQAMPVGEAMLKNPVAAALNMEMDELRRLMVDHHRRSSNRYQEPYPHQNLGRSRKEYPDHLFYTLFHN